MAPSKIPHKSLQILYSYYTSLRGLLRASNILRDRFQRFCYHTHVTGWHNSLSYNGIFENARSRSVTPIEGSSTHKRVTYPSFLSDFVRTIDMRYPIEEWPRDACPARPEWWYCGRQRAHLLEAWLCSRSAHRRRRCVHAQRRHL